MPRRPIRNAADAVHHAADGLDASRNEIAAELLDILRRLKAGGLTVSLEQVGPVKIPAVVHRIKLWPELERVEPLCKETP